MFFSDPYVPVGPPPQALLDQRWLWNVFIFLLSVTFLLRLLGVDIAGTLLSGLMLCFAIIMVQDGMHEMGKYAVIFAVLCALNFFFDFIPLITELGGRVSRHRHAFASKHQSDGTLRTYYTIETKTTPFFDPSEGFFYNVQSSALVLSPVTMVLGLILAWKAHQEIQRHAQPLWEDGAYAVDVAAEPAVVGAGDGAQAGGAEQLLRRTGAQDGRPTPQQTFERFTGQPYKLSG